MATLTIHDLDEGAKTRLQEMETANGRSMEAEARLAIYAYVKNRPRNRNLSAIRAVVPPEPKGFDWFAFDEAEAKDWDGA